MGTIVTPSRFQNSQTVLLSEAEHPEKNCSLVCNFQLDCGALIMNPVWGELFTGQPLVREFLHTYESSQKVCYLPF